MKRFFQAATLLGALALGQQAFAQNSVQIPTKDSKQELSQDSRQKDPFYIPRFSRENVAQYIAYQDNREQGLSLNYMPRINPDSENELKSLIRETPLLRTFYEISKDKEPVQLYEGRVRITFSASRRRSSPVNGLIRRFVKLVKK